MEKNSENAALQNKIAKLEEENLKLRNLLSTNKSVWINEALQLVGDAVCIVDSYATIKYETPGILNLLGLEKSLLGKSGLNLIHPDDQGLIKDLLAYLTEGNQISTSSEFRIKHQQGHWINVEVMANNLIDNPIINGIVVSLRDITQRKEHEAFEGEYRLHLEEMVKLRTEEYEVLNEELRAANEELFETNDELVKTNLQLAEEVQRRQDLSRFLSESQNKLVSYVDQSPEGIVLLDLQGRIIEWNQAMSQITQLGLFDVVGRYIWDIDFQFVTPEKRNEAFYNYIKDTTTQFLSTLNENSHIELQNDICLPNNIRKHLQNNIFPIKTPNSWYIGRITREISQNNIETTNLNEYRYKLEQMVKMRNNETNRARDLLFSVFQIMDEIVWICTEDSTFTFESPSASRLLGYEPGSMIGKRGIDFLHPDDIEKAKKIFLSIIQGEPEPKTPTELRFRNNRGGWSYIEAIGTNLLTNPHVEGILVNARIIDQRKKAELELINSEHKFRNIFAQSRQLISLLNIDGTILQSNKTTLQFLNCPSETLVGKHYCDTHWWTTDFDFKNKIYKALKSALGKKTTIFESCFETQPHTFKFFSFNIRPLFDTEGEVYMLVAECNDVTEEKNKQKKEKEYAAFLQTLIDTIPLPVYYKNIEGEYVGCNSGFERYTGLKREILIGNEIPEIFDNKTNNQYTTDNKEVKGSQKYETFIRHADGSLRNVIVHKKQYRDAEGKVAGVIGALFDITDIKKVENKLRNSETKFRNIFNASTEAIFICDLNLHFLEVNRTFYNLTGFTRREIQTLTAIDLITPLKQKEASESLNDILHKKIAYATDLDLLSKKGHSIPIELNSKLIELNDQPVILSVIRDITYRKKLEKQLLDAIIDTEEKERERMAGDLHDEIGPLLSGMKMYVSALDESTDADKRAYLTQQITLLVKEAIQSVREISNDLSPHVLNHYGLVSAIRNFTQGRISPPFVTFTTNCESIRFRDNIEIVFYRIVKELFNNTLKHSNAQNVKIVLNFIDKRIQLEYLDDGKGFELDSTLYKNKKGIGLLNIFSRIRSINGTYFIHTAPGIGFRIRISAENITL
jgi:PAS domain S-box-containing protein